MSVQCQLFASRFGEGAVRCFPMRKIDEYPYRPMMRRGTNRPDGSASGEVPATGRKIDMCGADFWRFEDGLIVQYNLYFDRFDFLTQLGALPSY